MADDIISKQLAYYAARAEEYDEVFQRVGRYDRGPDHLSDWQAEMAAFGFEFVDAPKRDRPPNLRGDMGVEGLFRLRRFCFLGGNNCGLRKG